MADTTPAVNDDGNEVTPAVAPATTDNDTSAVSDQDNLQPLESGDEDNWLDDVDKANPLKPEDIGSGEGTDDDDEAPGIDGDKLDDGEKPAEDAADKPKGGDQPAADADKSDTDKPQSAKDVRVEKLTEEIKDLKQSLGLEPNTDVRNLVSERNALKDMQSAQIRKAGLDLERKLLNMTDPDTGEAYSPADAARIARAATIDAEGTVASQEAYQIGVQRNQQLMERETLKAMSDFPIFMKKLADGTDNPDYDAELAELAGQHLNDAFVLEDSGNKDKDGKPVMVVVNIKRSPYEIMKSVADQATRLKAQSQAEKDKVAADAEAAATTNISRQAAGADVPVSGNTSSSRNDTVGEDFDQAFDEYDG
jgi:hypothetical protein